MNLYPVFINLENRHCLVVGGGNVAMRKIRALLKSKAKVTVVSPNLCPKLSLMNKKKEFIYKKDKYSKIILKNKFLVIAATNYDKLNKKIAYDANSMNMLVNVVDSPSECNFYVPSVVNKNGISLAISTYGAFPGLSKQIRHQIEKVVKNNSKGLKKLSKIRKDIYQSKETQSKKLKLAKSLLKPHILDLINKNRIKDVKSLNDFLKG